MRQALRYWFTFLYLFLVVGPVLAQGDKMAEAEKKAATYKEPSKLGEFFSNLFGDWTGWVMVLSIIGLIVLIAALLYVKKKQAED